MEEETTTEPSEANVRVYTLVEKVFIALVGVFIIEVLAAAAFYCIIFFAFSGGHDVTAVVFGTSVFALVVIAVPVVAIVKRNATIVYIFVTLVAIICVLLFLDFVTKSSSLPRHVDDCLFFIQYFSMAAVGFVVARQYQCPASNQNIALDDVINAINERSSHNLNITVNSRASCDSNSSENDDDNQLDARSVSELIVK